MHADAYNFVKFIADTMLIKEPIIEIGSKNINGSARTAFQGSKYFGIDIVDGKDVDLVIDITKEQAKKHLGKYKCLISTETLEHTDPDALVPAFFDYLSGECTMIITCASGKRDPHSAVDGGPLRDGEYYKNVSASELKKLLYANNGKFECIGYMTSTNDFGTDLYVFAEFVEKTNE
jgi:hypothetical protein